MLQVEHSAILLTFIKLPFSIKTFVLSIFKWPLMTGFTVYRADQGGHFVLIYSALHDKYHSHNQFDWIAYGL